MRFYILRFKQVKKNTKPIVLMISWFYGKKRQINKYNKLYTDQGMDVLIYRCTLKQFIFSVKHVEVRKRRISLEKTSSPIFRKTQNFSLIF
jgi:hypothetical protein